MHEDLYLMVVLLGKAKGFGRIAGMCRKKCDMCWLRLKHSSGMLSENVGLESECKLVVYMAGTSLIRI